MRTNLPHLPAPFVFLGSPKLNGGGSPPAQEVANKRRRDKHSKYLVRAGENANAYWSQQRSIREGQGRPVLPEALPLLIKVEPGSNLDYLRSAFEFEIVAEHEDGIVIVCAEDIDLERFLDKAAGFEKGVRGSGGAAKIYEIFGPDNQDVRLRNILDQRLYERWGQIEDSKEYVFDVSVECLGTVKIPNIPKRTKRDTDESYEKKYQRWLDKKNSAINEFEDIQMTRESEILRFVADYGGAVCSMFTDDFDPESVVLLPDSLTVRIEAKGICLKDIAINYPYVFEVSDPEEVTVLDAHGDFDYSEFENLVTTPPQDGAPYVCVIDSGIQEKHQLIELSIDSVNSHCFIPTESQSDVADYVSGGGHGTRVAGAILYGDKVPDSGQFQHPFWIRNARVLDQNNALQERMLPSVLLNKIVKKYSQEIQPSTKIYNHSINASVSFRASRMSAWAATIDNLTWENDVVFIQSAGNVRANDGSPKTLGVMQHLAAQRGYPNYLLEPSCRIANPAQSMHAITVGSISRKRVHSGDRSTLASEDSPSSFSRSGLGMWNCVKPDVVEYGGDYAVDAGSPPQVGLIEAACPELVRANLTSGGPAVSMDAVGTSFAAPKVARIAASIEAALPGEPANLYRSLIGVSARWPDWAERDADKAAVIRTIGYGIPSLDRALYSTDKRVTLVTSGVNLIGDREGHIYRVPIPDSFRSAGQDFNVRIDVCLSYIAPTRRTRRHPRNYFGTWLEWKCSKLGETYESLKARLFHVEDDADMDGEDVIPWSLRERRHWGAIENTSRSNGSLQKDWVELPAHSLPEDLCIAVVGHAGWDANSISKAKYSLSISIEAVDTDLNIYELVETEIQALSEVESEVLV